MNVFVVALILLKDDENVNSQPFMRWRDRFLFCAETIFKSQAETGEIKGHYLNATAGTCGEMMKRAIFARELGVPIVMHDYLTGILAWLIIAEIMVYFFTSTAQCMQLLIDRRIMVNLKGKEKSLLGFVDLLRDDFIEKYRSRGIYFTQDWVSLPGVLPVALGGIHVWRMPAVTEIFEDDSILQFGGGTLGHTWGNAPGAVALEACVQARNEGRDLATEGNEIIREATKWSLELAAACEVWKEIKFEFQAMDTLDQ
ncbi:unnamed protein product [Lactuca virosa]|uniref:Ribulose bisphosphate carboxylase large subunit C-terminal domain-containing protein n=1 Tax=Lactuca virosa TaxID=75947 RepID=A0AAU9N1N8_9ASTR|nr:unnamed protein product [Lactuca virosa]